MVASLMVSAKLATLDLLKIKLFLVMMTSTKIYYGLKLYCRCVHVTLTSIYKDLTRKTNFFEGYPWFKFNNLGLALGMALKF